LRIRYLFIESCSLGVEHKIGGSFHLQLNIGGIPIANKYREGKMKRTSTGVLKLHETAEREASAN
jgi:hypothetical protein